MGYNVTVSTIQKIKGGGKTLNNKGVGSIFCLIAALLMSARYLSAAIFLSGVSSWDAALFSSGLEYVGSPLKIMAIVSLGIGILFLIYGMYQDRKKDTSAK